MGMQEYYQQRAREYEEIYHRDEPRRQKEQADIASALKTILQGRKVLEVACGTGYWTQYVSQTAASVVATDINKEVLDIARTTKEYSVPTDFVQSDAFNLPFQQHLFDGGFANLWFSHLRKSERKPFLDHFHSKLQPGAQVIMADNVFNEGVGGELVRPEGEEDTYKLRTLKDGRQYLIIKNYPTYEELIDIFRGYTASFNEGNVYCGNHFWFVSYILR